MKRPPVLSGWLLLLLMTSPAHAEGVQGASATQTDDPLGRLFFTHEQRILLNRMRLGLPVAVEQPPELEEPPPANKVITGPRYVSVTGLVLKENGRHAVWVNGQQIETQERFAGEGFYALPGQLDRQGLPVASVDSTRLFYLKSGQTLDLVEERVFNTHEIDPRLLQARREPPPAVDKERPPPPDPRGAR
ncbi:MAG: hypothetical protein H7838_01510 [Magnetococcus sp. DMHC-8]